MFVNLFLVVFFDIIRQKIVSKTLLFCQEKTMNEELEDIMRRLCDLERKLEKYYDLLVRQNELDFVLNGTYILEDDIDDILDGTWEE